MANCGSCEAPVRWVTTFKGNAMPIDADPDPVRGNIVITSNSATGPVRASVLGFAEAATARARGDRLYVSHFATCPNSQQHRKR